VTLSRRDLEQNRMRAIYAQVVTEKRALTDEQLSASLTTTLAAKPPGAGWWVFGYGSLLWNPLFPVAEMRPAIVGGLHRRSKTRGMECSDAGARTVASAIDRPSTRVGRSGTDDHWATRTGCR